MVFDCSLIAPLGPTSNVKFKNAVERRQTRLRESALLPLLLSHLGNAFPRHLVSIISHEEGGQSVMKSSSKSFHDNVDSLNCIKTAATTLCIAFPFQGSNPRHRTSGTVQTVLYFFVLTLTPASAYLCWNLPNASESKKIVRRNNSSAQIAWFCFLVQASALLIKLLLKRLLLTLSVPSSFDQKLRKSY